MTEPVAIADARMQAARAEFPIVSRVVYFNSNSTGAMPRGMRRVLAEYWEVLESWRDDVWERWWVDLHAYADSLAGLIGAAQGSVVTDQNLSTLLGRLFTSIDFRARPRVVTSDLEFPTTPFLIDAFKRYGAERVTIPSRDNSQIDVDALLAAIDEKTRIVCISHATFQTGALLPLARVVARARDVGAWVLVDAYQSVGVVPIDVCALGVDFLLGGAHKWLCGAIESAFMYIRPELIDELEPAATGWIAAKDPLTFAPATEWAATARRFASGTPAVLPALLSQVALPIIRDIGVAAIRATSERRTARIIALADEAGIEVATPREAERRGGIVCLRFPGAESVTAKLNRAGFICSFRGGLRVAPHFYNTDDEVLAFMSELVSVARRESR